MEGSGDSDDVILWEYIGGPAAWSVGSIINQLEGTTVFRGYASCGDTDQEEMIGIEPTYPWLMNEKDRMLTKEKVTAILEKYAAILGVTQNPDDFEASYCG
jgi:hypothetical protein